MSTQSSRGINHCALVAASIIIAAVVLSASLVVAPAMETTKTSTATSVVTTTSPQIIATSTLNFTSTILSTITITESSMPLLPCDHFVWNLTSSKGLPVLIMGPDFTGYVCVTYHVHISAYSPNPTQLTPIHVGKYSCSAVNGASSCLPNDSHSFQNSVIPNNVTLSGSFSYFTVVYIVKALSNATGFYDYSAPWRGGCGFGVPLAVGYSASQVNASDFTQPPASSCPYLPAPDVVPIAEYVTGMNVTYLQGL